MVYTTKLKSNFGKTNFRCYFIKTFCLLKMIYLTFLVKTFCLLKMICRINFPQNVLSKKILSLYIFIQFGQKMSVF